MGKVKILSMYLPQYHRTPENDFFWGEGFTDWVSVTNASKLFTGHLQPRIPLNNNYYDLSKKQNIVWQTLLAKKYGVHGFGIYHYWFSNNKVLLTKPAEIILNNPDIDFPFFFAWDNISWKRTWSKIKGNDWAPISDNKKSKQSSSEILIKYDLGDERDWEKHFNYLLPYFQDQRYIRYCDKPIFIIFHYSHEFEEIEKCWNKLAESAGLCGISFIYRFDPIIKIPQNKNRFSYEPIFSGWGDTISRGISKFKQFIGLQSLQKYNYDKVWKQIIKNSERNNNIHHFPGAFVQYDDSPRRGNKGKVILDATPEKFQKYMKLLIRNCEKQGKEFIFLTAWNEWGEGAYLEPDNNYRYAYLQALHEALEETKNL